MSTIRLADLPQFVREQLGTRNRNGCRIDPVLRHYRLLRALGKTVVLAEHTHMKRRVVLKFLPPHLIHDEQALKRFYRQARKAAKLDHKHIAHAHDVVQEGKLHFLVLEYIEGCDLQRLVERNGPLDEARVVDVIWQTALGMQHLHERNMFHGELQPRKLLIDRAGRVKILGLGLSRIQGDDTLTRGSSAIGKAGLDYQAPEVAQCSTLNVKSDIFALGRTLCFLRTGNAKLVGKLSKELGVVVRRMTAMDQAKRYGSAVEVIHALEPLRGKPTPLDLSFFLPLKKAKPRASRMWVWAAAACIGIVGILAGMVVLASFIGCKTPPTSVAATPTETKPTPTEKHPYEQRGPVRVVRGIPSPVSHCAISPDSKLLALCTTGRKVCVWDLERYRCDSDYEFDGTIRCLSFVANDRLCIVANAKGLDDESTRYDVQVGLPMPKGVKVEAAMYFAVSTDGSMLAAGKNKSLWLRDENADQPVRRKDFAEDILALSFSPDASQLAIVHDFSICLLDLGSWSELSTYRIPDALINSADFSPDQRWMLFNENFTNKVRILEARTGKERMSIFNDSGLMGTSAFSSDGRLFCAELDFGKEIIVWDLLRLVRRTILKGHDASVSLVHFTPDGKSLICIDSKNSMYIWDLSQAIPPDTGVRITLSVKELDSLWTDLLSSEGSAAYQAVVRLVDGAEYSVPYLKKTLRGDLELFSKDRINRLIADATTGDSMDRDRAREELIRLGPAVFQQVRVQQENAKEERVRQRLQEVLDKLGGRGYCREQLRIYRVVEVYERIGGRTGLDALEGIETDADWARADIQSAIRRLRIMVPQQ